MSYYTAALNNTDTKATFQVLNSVTNSNDHKLPAPENDNIMCVAFAELFDEKVQKIIDFTRRRITVEYVVLPLLLRHQFLVHSMICVQQTKKAFRRDRLNVAHSTCYLLGC